MNVTKRADPRAERAHAAVIEAAVELFLDEGIAAFTIEAVAARSGVAKTTIYRRWANRDELLLEVFGQFSLGLELPPPELPPIERVRSVARQFAAALGTPESRRMMPALFGAALHMRELAGLHDRIEAHQARVVSTVLAEARAAGALPPDLRPEDALFSLLGPMMMAAMMRPEAIDQGFADRLVDRLVVAPLASDRDANGR